jgi:hypothetical protein
MSEQQAPKKKVKVKFLKHVMEFVPGQVVELSEDYARQVCKATEVWDGTRLVSAQRAMLLEDAEKLEKITKEDIAKMSVAQMNELGVKNVVETPAAEIAAVAAKAATTDESKDVEHHELTDVAGDTEMGAEEPAEEEAPSEDPSEEGEPAKKQKKGKK